MKTHPRFYELLDEMKSIAEKKGSDYSGKEDVYRNFHACEDFGIPAWIGVLIRITDKHSRLKELTMKATKGESPEVKDETIKDTMIDLANYCLICRVLFEEWEQNLNKRKEDN